MYPKSASDVAFDMVLSKLSMFKRAGPYRVVLDIIEKALSLRELGVSKGDKVKRSLSTASGVS
jgi:hypothetical protein